MIPKKEVSILDKQGIKIMAKNREAYHEYFVDEKFEAGLELTVDNVRPFTTLHPRCGTAFLLVVMVVSIVMFAFLGWPDLVERILSRVILMPVVAGVAYEIIRYAGRHETSFMRIAIAPGLWLQKLTTKEPTDDQIEVAIRALNEVRPDRENVKEA